MALLATPQGVVGRATELASLYNAPWVASAAYALGATVTNGGNVYVAQTAGTSGTSGPSGFAPSGITDGAVVWGFTTLDPVSTALSDAALQIDGGIYGAKTALAQTYLAAHLLCVRYPNLANPAGPVSADRVGDVQASYAVSAAPASENDYNTTRWGQAFRTLGRQLIAGRFFVNGPAPIPDFSPIAWGPQPGGDGFGDDY